MVLIIDFYHSTDNVGGFRWRRFAKYLTIPHIVLTSGDFEDDDNVFHVPCIFKTGVSNGFALDRPSLWGRIKRFIRGNFFIPDPRRLWFVSAYSKARKLVRQYKISLIITTGPPHSVHLLGLKLKRELGVKWIADFRDPWLPYYYKDMYLTRFAKRLQEYYEWEVVCNADCVIACEEGIVEHTNIVSNGYDPDDFEVACEKKGGAVHCGTLLGEVPMPFRQVFGVSHQESIKEMIGADSLVLSCPYDIIPSKTYEYLYTGKPIHFFGVKGKCSKLITKCIEDKEEIKKYDVRELVKEVERIIYYYDNRGA